MTILKGTILEGYLTGKLGGEHVLYTADLISLVVQLAAIGYVATCTVDAAISFTKGFYFNYAKKSEFADLMYVYELVVVIAFFVWCLLFTYFAFYFADEIWQTTEARMAEAAADSKGVETALTWGKVFKSVTIMMVTALSVVISGFSLGDVADELIGYIDNYDDKTGTEGNKKDDPTDFNPAGTAALEDIGESHLITTFFSYVVFMAIPFGGYWFMDQFLKINEDPLVCDFTLVDKAFYDDKGTYNLLQQIIGYDECMAVIDEMFAIEDLDGNGLVTRCEDALFQHHFAGATESYATKFSGQFTRGAYKEICRENFPDQAPAK